MSEVNQHHRTYGSEYLEWESACQPVMTRRSPPVPLPAAVAALLSTCLRAQNPRVGCAVREGVAKLWRIPYTDARRGTHYDGPPPGFPATGPLVEWLVTGLFPQLTMWIAFTRVIGMLFGGVPLL